MKSGLPLRAFSRGMVLGSLLLGWGCQGGDLPGFAPTPQEALDEELRSATRFTMAPGLPEVLGVERTSLDSWVLTSREEGREGTFPWEVELAERNPLPLLHGEAFAEHVHEALLEYTRIPGLPDSLRIYLTDGRVQEMEELVLRLRRSEMPGYITVRRLALREEKGWELAPRDSPVGLVYAGVRVAYLAAAADIPSARTCLGEQGAQAGPRCARDALAAQLGLQIPEP
ncbi:MAG: hypothetical protein WEA09_03135 [Gemmatimonadota bacterium]